jgi:CRISPR-associated protein Cmr6
MSERYNLPAVTATAVNDHVARCKNLSLILDRYTPALVVEDTKNKGPWLQDLIDEQHIDADLARAVYQRWQAMLAGVGATRFDLELDWRMVVGLGGSSVVETALTLHRLHGLPFIPASALKGLTRSYVTGEIEGHLSLKIEDDDETILRIFGSQKQAGTVLFFDAMPRNGQAAFALDIMNPHYSDYYGGDKKALPTNDKNPIPVTFLTIASTAFSFAIAPRDLGPADRVSADKLDEQRKDVEQVSIWLQEALSKYGIGGKTSAGYGYFHPAGAEPPASAAPAQIASRPVEHIRPAIPQFRPNQEIRGAVIAPTEELRRIAPEAQAFMSYESFISREVLVILTAEEAQTWKQGETRYGLFEHEEMRNGCSVLFCVPRAKKEKKK